MNGKIPPSPGGRHDSAIADDTGSTLDWIQRFYDDPWSLLSTWPARVILALLAANVLFAVVRHLIRRRRFRRASGRLHPRLEPYAGAIRDLPPEARAMARYISATSSTQSLIGYEIVRQIEALHVDGYRDTQDALDALKALAASKGANALTNVHHGRGDRGRHHAGGDAVVARPASTVPGPGTVPTYADTGEEFFPRRLPDGTDVSERS